MKLAEAIDEVRKIAKRSNYDGKLTEGALKECAEVYLESCDSEGTPKPRVYMRSGEGHKVTHLSEMQWLIVRTPSFRSWFGKSVVVDENGDPKVMYHGSWRSFSEFKTSAIKLSKVAMTLWSGPGFYFTDKEKVAKIYAGGEDDTVYDVFLRLENPLMVDETGNSEEGMGISKKAAEKIFLDGDNTQWLDSGIANELVRMDVAEGVKGRGKQFYKAMSRQQRVLLYVARLKTDVVKLKTAALAYGAKSQKKLLESICRHTGHDGVIHTISPDVKEWVVYDPKSIKSANDNNGDFSTAKAKVEDSVEAPDANNRHNLEEKGSSDMVFKSLVDSLSKLVGTPAEDHAVAMDIVDRHGRHHQPKAIPEGGQYEEEGQYLHGQAKVDAAIRSAGSGKHASLLREHVAPLYAKLGHDSATRAKLQAMHEDIRGLSKGALLKGMAKHLKDMKRHAEAHNEIKDMGKEEFKEWLDAHPEYKTEMTERLLGKNMYNRHYDVKGGFHDDGTGKQKHEAWEEAKWSIGAKAMASMILFQEHADALDNAPDAIMANMIERATREEPQVENEAGATPQIPPTEQITAGHEDIWGERGTIHEPVPGDNLRNTYLVSLGDNTAVPADTEEQAREILNTFNTASIEHPGVIQRQHEAERGIFNVVYGRSAGESYSVRATSAEEAINEFRNRVARQTGSGRRWDNRESYVETEGETAVSNAERMGLEPADIAQAINALVGNDDGVRDQTRDDVWQAISNNFEGQIGEAIAERLRNSNLDRNHPVIRAIGDRGRSEGTESSQQGNNAHSEANVGSNAPTYTDRDGNVHTIEHNEGGLKATIHPSELAAVEAEKAKAFADAGNGVEGAEEYAHALSHFLGRGQDARSPHPGMRQDGLLKHQLADKMQTRLEEKFNAWNEAETAHGVDSPEADAALRDFMATRRAVNTIADRCGITPDMLPEGTNFNRVRNALGAPIRAANPDHQEAVNALHALANPAPENEESQSQNEPVGEPTDAMRDSIGQYRDIYQSTTGESLSPHELVNHLNDDNADNEIDSIRHGSTGPNGDFVANPDLADHLEAIRRLPREQQLAHVQRLMGVEPTDGNAQQNHNRTRISPAMPYADALNIAREQMRNAGLRGEPQILDNGETNDIGEHWFTLGANGDEALQMVIKPDGSIHYGVQSNDNFHSESENLAETLNMARENGVNEFTPIGESGRLNDENTTATGVHSDGRSDTDEPMPRETDEPTTAPTQNIGEHAHSLAERIHGELDRIQRSSIGEATQATVEGIESAITRALSNPDNEYARALMGENTDRGYSGIADAVNAIGNTPEMQAIRSEIQRRREAGNGQQNIAGVQENATQTTQTAQQISNAPAQNAETVERNGNELAQHLNDFINGETNRSRGRARLGRYYSNTQRIIDNLNRGDLSIVSDHTRDIYSHFRDANNPVVRQIREIRNNIARNLPAASDSAGHIAMFDEANITPRYSVNRFNPTTAQQVTQRDVDNIIARMNGSASIHSYDVDESRRAGLGVLDKQGLLSAFIRNPEMWNGRYNNADDIMRRLRSSRNPATKAYVRAFDALHPNFANRAEERQRAAEATRAMNGIAGHSTVTSQNARAPEGSPLASVTDDQWRSAEQRVNSAMPGHEDIVSRAFGALRSGQVNSDVSRYESTIANILGSTDPVVRAINEHVSASLNMEERTRRNFVNTRPSVPDDIKQANDQAMASFEKVRPGWQYDISQFGRIGGHNCYMNDLYAMLHNLGYKVGYPPGRDGEHTPRNTKAFFDVKKALLEGGAEPFVPNTREEIEGKLSEIARTRPNGTWLSIWSGGHNKSAVLQDGQWIFLDAYMGSNPRFATNEEIAGKVWPKDLVIRGSRRDGGLAGAVAQGLIDHNPTDEELAKIGGAMIIDPSKFRITQDLVSAMR